jgi:hypothetical protein
MTVAFVKKATGTLTGGGLSGVKVTGMRPKRLPFSDSVYIVTVPLRMVEVEPLRASTCVFAVPGPTIVCWRSLMSTVEAVNFRTFLIVPL